jgi:hypothetical protein
MHCRSVVRTGFNPVSIAVMVIGFMIAWPLGLLVLAYILWGERFGWRDRLQSFTAGLRDGIVAGSFRSGRPGFGFSSGNAAFDAHRAREMERLEAERRRLDEERREFEAYMRDLRRARDQEEFDRFKAERSRRRGGATI